VNPPRGLSPGARKVWDRLAPDLIDKGCLTAWDVDMFRVYCDAVAIFHECRELMGSDFLVEGSVGNKVRSPYWAMMRDCAETMIRIGGRFGLTPSDRASLDVSDHDRAGRDTALSGFSMAEWRDIPGYESP
jgi:P27 family predicted phage terminase small subunit